MSADEPLPFLRDPAFRQLIQDVRRTDNRTNWLYIVRSWLYLLESSPPPSPDSNGSTPPASAGGGGSRSSSPRPSWSVPGNTTWAFSDTRVRTARCSVTAG